jgi:hypothetical protein
MINNIGIAGSAVEDAAGVCLKVRADGPGNSRSAYNIAHQLQEQAENVIKQSDMLCTVCNITVTRLVVAVHLSLTQRTVLAESSQFAAGMLAYAGVFVLQARNSGRV